MTAVPKWMRHVVSCALVVAATGCSGGGNSDDPFGIGVVTTTTATTPAESTSVSSEPDSGAPEVPEPLDIEGIVADPCAALTEAQLIRLDVVEPGRPGTMDCSWSLTTGTYHGVIVSLDSSLDEVYASGVNKYFQETTIAGYPAVYASVLDQRAQGGCNLWVGVTDDVAVGVSTVFLDVDPCPVAERFATSVVEGLLAG